MIRLGIIVSGLLMCVPATVSAASLQKEFDAAQAAAEKRDFAKAAVGFEKVLEKLPKADPKNRTLAQVRARLGSARMALRDYRGAADVLELALSGLAGDADWIDRQNTLEELGKAREALLDYDGARQVYAALLSELESQNGPRDGNLEGFRTSLVNARISLARVSLFEQPDVARKQLDLALPEAEAMLGRKNDLLGALYTMRGRTDLMAGNPKDAYGWFSKGLRAAGGLGRKVSLMDVRVRGDLALSAQLLGNASKAREYLAYTGAGIMRDKNPLMGADMPLPACGDATGLKPADAAVVEFGIGDDGQVTFVQPVYATRTGPVALEFARAVAQWSWTPEELADSDAFWRSNVRLELRCTKRVERTDLLSTFHASFAEWLGTLGVIPQALQADDNVNASQAMMQLRSALFAKEAEKGVADISLLPLLTALGQNPAVPTGDALVYLFRAEIIAAEHNAPADVRIMLRGLNIKRRSGQTYNKKVRSALRQELSALLGELKQRGEVQSRGSAWVQTELAGVHEWSRDFASAEQLYRDVVALPDTALADADPIRQLAVVRLASLKVAAKSFDEAEGILQSAGLDAEQCALVDVKPMALNAHMGSSDFPNEALFWGFEGWVKVSYDIGADGRVLEPRAVIAYPPFVFSAPTEKAVSRFRYMPIYRGGQSIGCTGYDQTVKYTISR